MNLYLRKIIKLYSVLKNVLFYKIIFGGLNIKASIISPLRINGASHIYIGNSRIGYKTWLAARPHTGYKDVKLIIEDGCTIGNFNHIYATKSIILHNSVLTADKVYISDNLHDYRDINIPIKDQPIVQKNCVEIGEGSWLGENVCVIGAKIGKHCVIGANSVVTKDIPDFCVAVGAPAKVIKHYDFNKKLWVKS